MAGNQSNQSVAARSGSDPVSTPDWYQPSTARLRANERVARGLHPFGRDLGPEHSRCGSCVHVYSTRMRGAKKVFKCEVSSQSAGAATDVVLRWRGCSQWVARDLQDTLGALVAAWGAETVAVTLKRVLEVRDEPS